MIGRSFKGCVNYVVSKIDKGYGQLLESRGVRDFNKKLLVSDFIARQKVNPKLSRCVWHTTLSFQDQLSSDEMLCIAKDWMERMELSNTQYIVVRHTDTEHHHLHIVANRIDDDGATVSDSNNWKRSEKICRTLTEIFKLTPLPEYRDEEKINRKKLKGRDLLKTDINRIIERVIAESTDMMTFSTLMNSHGFNCFVTLGANETVRGISFERDGVRLKASDINKNLSAQHIEKKIRLNSVKQKNSLEGRMGM